MIKSAANRQPYVGEIISNYKIFAVEHRRNDSGSYRYYCSVECQECGNKKISVYYSLKSRTAGCVCPLEGKYAEKHGMYGSKEHITWRSMLQRCYDKSCSSYRLYGARGIFVCKEWKDDFMSFYSDMGGKPKGMSLDRIDPNLSYYKENCRWSTFSTQAHNKRPLTAGFKGVTKNTAGSFTSRIMVKGKSISIGSFKSPLFAALMYDKKAIEIRGELASTNESLGLLTAAQIKRVYSFYECNFTQPQDLYIEAIMRGADEH